MILQHRVLAAVSIGVIYAFVLSACATVPTSAYNQPLPGDMRIETPGPDVSAELAAFSGKWVGYWGNALLDGVLVVEKIQGRQASVIYSWGVYPAWEIRTPGFVRVDGTIDEQGTLRVPLHSTVTAEYRLAPDRKTLEGVYISRFGRTPGTFRKQE